MDGRPGTLADLQEGTKVKAAYVPRDGKDVVILIEVVPGNSTHRVTVLHGTDDRDAEPGPGHRPSCETAYDFFFAAGAENSSLRAFIFLTRSWYDDVSMILLNCPR